MEAYLDFEKPISVVEKKLLELRELERQDGVNLSKEIAVLENKVKELIEETYSKLSSWQRVQLSRHPNRPYSRDIIDALFPEFFELQGDRCFANDPAILGGISLWPPLPTRSERRPILILGHQKGRSTKQKMERNFGMARPEGYRKAIRLLEMAERAKMPVLTFIDTPGAYPAIDAEERGQSQAIAESILKLFSLSVPVLTVIIGEGGSGGALALAVGNRVLMQEYATYSVISPEGCASILWSDAKFAERASEVLKVSPPELLKLGVIDEVIPEPIGGAHRDWTQSFELLKKALIKNFEPYLSAEKSPSPSKIRSERRTKFREMGLSAIAEQKSRRVKKPR